jgi:2-polyprenyl-6-hydroxyphenyl methylase/3-demethylubiquinone-9 3-methyltransferase
MTVRTIAASAYHYGAEAPVGSCHHGYLLPAVLTILKDIQPDRILDLGCGNGFTANELSRTGYSVIGVDPSLQGVEAANRHYPHLSVELGSTEEDLVKRLGRFPVVLSLEVVEHVYDPRTYAASLFDLVEGGGTAIISTPYHGYLKNLAIALFNKWDAHHDPLWPHGHIKFWSMATLSKLLRDAGFRDIRYKRVGRAPPLAKSMIAVARKP